MTTRILEADDFGGPAASRYGWDSFLSMSPFCLYDEGRVHMPLRGYYDGSKRSGSCRLIVLGGLAGTEAVWPEFESLWKSTLEVHRAPLYPDGIRRFHMADAMSLKDEFSREKGWDCDRVRVLVMALFNVMAEFKTKPVMALSCCVDLQEHQEALDKNPALKSPEEICCDFCVGGIRIPDEDQGKPKSVILYFDRGETFLRRVDRAWRSRPETKRKGWARQVKAIVHTDSSAYAVQAADMISWLAGSRYLDPKAECGLEGWLDVFWHSTFIALDHYHKLFGLRELTEYKGA